MMFPLKSDKSTFNTGMDTWTGFAGAEGRMNWLGWAKMAQWTDCTENTEVKWTGYTGTERINGVVKLGQFSGPIRLACRSVTMETACWCLTAVNVAKTSE